VGQPTADLLRILLADDDDANAFLFQCGVNRLDRPCAFQRVAAPAQLAEKIQSFRPAIVIAAGVFSEPAELRGLKQFTNGHPVICAVADNAAAEEALAAGAADCVLISQVDELHTCIERHLNGESKAPYFRKNEVQDAPAREKTPSKLDLKLEEFDKWVGAMLRRFASAARVKAQKLRRVSAIAGRTARAETRRLYKAANVRWMLHKQRKLVETDVGNNDHFRREFTNFGTDREMRPVESASSARTNGQSNQPKPSQNQSRGTPMMRIRSEESSLGDTAAFVPQGDDETLRTLELSFKTLFHTALDPMFLLDGLGCFLHANAPARALLGLPPAELLGKSLLDFVSNEEKTQVSAMWEAMLIEGQQKAEVRLRSAAGDEREVFVSARSNLWFGVHLLIVRDQTELKRLREAVRSVVKAA
jgi:PAS domain S-box-containing protein